VKGHRQQRYTALVKLTEVLIECFPVGGAGLFRWEFRKASTGDAAAPRGRPGHDAGDLPVPEDVEINRSPRSERFLKPSLEGIEIRHFGRR
jgi:hypothetical protein